MTSRADAAVEAVAKAVVNAGAAATERRGGATCFLVSARGVNAGARWLEIGAVEAVGASIVGGQPADSAVAGCWGAAPNHDGNGTAGRPKAK